MDVECLQNIDNFILQYPNSNFMVSSFPSSINKTIGLLFNKKYVNNGIIFSDKNHPILNDLLKNAHKNKYWHWYYLTPEIYIVYSIGIEYFNKFVNLNLSDNVIVVDSKYFEPSIGHNKTPDNGVAYFCHHHQWSWCNELVPKIFYFYMKYKLIIFIFIIIAILVFLKQIPKY